MIRKCGSVWCIDPSNTWCCRHPQVHKKLGQTHLALMNFSWAMDLDPKGANNQFKEAIDPAINRFPVDDDDTTNNNPHDNGESAANTSSSSFSTFASLSPLLSLCIRDNTVTCI